MFLDVRDFHAKFGLPHAAADRRAELLTDNVMLYRINFLMEELAEIGRAHQRGDLAGVTDGLIDLVYVALGTAHLMGVPWEGVWAEVQRANMAKQRVTRPETSKRGHALDVIKPPGWRGPQILDVLNAWNARVDWENTRSIGRGQLYNERN